MFTPTNILVTISGVCTTVGGLGAFQAFGNSSPLSHKIYAIVMGAGAVAAYLAASPLFKTPSAAAEDAKKAMLSEPGSK